MPPTAMAPLGHDRSSQELVPLWIWTDLHGVTEQNARFLFQTVCHLAAVEGDYVVRISADSRYRLLINGEWVNDGPSRFYPDTPLFDEIPVAHYLRTGVNDIRVEVLHFGVDTLQYIRGDAGLWFELSPGGGHPILVSNTNWVVSDFPHYVANTPRISPQLGFEEQWDFTRRDIRQKNALLSSRTTAPQRRRLRLCGAERRSISTIIETAKTSPMREGWTIHSRELLTPFPGGINVHGLGGVITAKLCVEQEDVVELLLLGIIEGVYLDGVRLCETRDQDLRRYALFLTPGTHWLAVSFCGRADHCTELSIGYNGGSFTQWMAASDDVAHPWRYSLPLWKWDRDTNCPISKEGGVDPKPLPFLVDAPAVKEKIKSLISTQASGEVEDLVSPQWPPVPSKFLADSDAYFDIRTDKVDSVHFTGTKSMNEGILLGKGDRVILDLGDITNGYVQFDVETATGAVFDAFFFEYCKLENHEIQFLQNDGLSYRNSLRCRFAKGKSSFHSAQRRGFRYMLIVAREAETLARFTNVGVVESIYPPSHRAEFRSSDPRLNQIFSMGQRTLNLCMEDTFTDCPSYEQAFWVGDARNEALFAAVTFGAYDLIEHCNRLVAQSTETLPLAACQCPSGWDAILPSFSFAWVLSCWEIYQQTGSHHALRDTYPAIKATLNAAAKFCTDDGLFSAPTWNFFDWAPIDQDGNTVLHNSLLLAAALTAGAKIAAVLDEEADRTEFQRDRERLAHSLSEFWDPLLRGFPDALHSNGPSQRTSQHTSILALLYDLVSSEDHRKQALENCVNPPTSMTKVGSPFTMFFLLEALTANGQGAKALQIIRDYWGQMVDLGSSTCWEMVHPPESKFPTRSHCHGWAASPVYLLPKLFFGIEILEPGWKQIRISPNLHGLEEVRCSLCTPFGMLNLSLSRQASGEIQLHHEGPKEVVVKL